MSLETWELATLVLETLQPPISALHPHAVSTILLPLYGPPPPVTYRPSRRAFPPLPPLPFPLHRSAPRHDRMRQFSLSLSLPRLLLCFVNHTENLHPSINGD